MQDGVGIRSEYVSPREARRRERERARLLRRPFVIALTELRGVALSWAIGGSLVVLLALALGGLFHLTPIEYAATGGALFLPPAASLATLMLGRCTPPFMLSRLILDRAPAPPEEVKRDPPERPIRRVALAAIAVGIGMIPA